MMMGEFGMPRSHWDHKIIDVVRAHFGRAAGGFVIKESTCEPRLMVVIDMMLFEYFVVRISVEGDSAYFGIVLPGYQVSLFESKLGEAEMEISMARLSDDIRLRIPDKYLKSKGWQS